MNSRTCMTVAQALHTAQSRIAQVDARLLLQHALGKNHAQLLAYPEQVLTPAEEKLFLELAARRASGEPVAYLIGEREFYSLNFRVSPAVLIPRPETELLVDLALERIPANHPCKVLDLGTGSGAIAISIAKHRPLACVTAVDAADDAVAIAGMNARQLEANNVRIVAGDWFNGLAGEKFDLIVSNPPYVADGDPHLGQGDLRFEPRAALAAGADGLDCLRSIIAAAATHLLAGGWLLLEHGYDQAGACGKLLAEAGFGEGFSRPDLAGVMRVSGGRANGAGAKMQHSGARAS